MATHQVPPQHVSTDSIAPSNSPLPGRIILSTTLSIHWLLTRRLYHVSPRTVLPPPTVLCLEGLYCLPRCPYIDYLPGASTTCLHGQYCPLQQSPAWKDYTVYHAVHTLITYQAPLPRVSTDSIAPSNSPLPGRIILSTTLSIHWLLTRRLYHVSPRTVLPPPTVPCLEGLYCLPRCPYIDYLPGASTTCLHGQYCPLQQSPAWKDYTVYHAVHTLITYRAPLQHVSKDSIAPSNSPLPGRSGICARSSAL